MFLKAETASGDECEHRQHAYKPSDGKHKYKHGSEDGRSGNKPSLHDCGVHWRHGTQRDSIRRLRETRDREPSGTRDKADTCAHWRHDLRRACQPSRELWSRRRPPRERTEQRHDGCRVQRDNIERGDSTGGCSALRKHYKYGAIHGDGAMVQDTRRNNKRAGLW